VQSILQSPGFVPVAAVAVLSLLMALVLRSFTSGRRVVSRREAFSFSVVASLAIAMLAWWLGLRKPWPEAPPLESRSGSFITLPPSGRVFDETRTTFLQVGDRLPRLAGSGWLNGPAIPLQKPRAAVTVVDIWNELCPVCHEAAPGLKRVYEKYRDRDVQFVGITPRSRELAEEFLERHNIPWPNAYGVSHVGQSAPQVFVLDQQGQIIWWDERLRYQHLPKRLEAELDKVIETVLSGGRG
jgi:thiol-disulfide isomerase/thioredoxin